MERHSTSPEQLHLHLGAAERGPEEVVLPFEPDESVAYGTPRLKGSFSTRVDEVVAPRRSAALTVEGERFFAKVVVRNQSYEVAGSVVARPVRPFGEPDADPQLVVERVDVHAAKKFVNGHYHPIFGKVPAEVAHAAERLVTGGYAAASAAAAVPAEPKPDETVAYRSAA